MEEKLARQNEEEREEYRQERTALFQERWETQNEMFKLEQQIELPALVGSCDGLCNVSRHLVAVV